MWKNLAPGLIRQRLIIEGQIAEMPSSKKVKDYLISLSKISGMKVILKPRGISNYPGGGIAMWIHWSTSGAHFYSYYSTPNNRKKVLKHPFFTLDTYTCKPFSVKKIVSFTKNYFNTINIVWKEIKV